MGEIAGRLELPSHAISPLLDRLERAGLVVRQRAGPDRRVVRVRLAPAGAGLELAAARAQRTVACRTGLDPAALAGHVAVLGGQVAAVSQPCTREPSAGSTRGSGKRPPSPWSGTPDDQAYLAGLRSANYVASQVTTGLGAYYGHETLRPGLFADL